MGDKVEYLPLGSIVIVNGGVRKYVIVARGLQVKVNGINQFFDYGACMYPEGMIGDQFFRDMIKEIKTDDRKLAQTCEEFDAFISDLKNYRLEDIENFIMQHYPQIYQEVKRADTGKSGFIASTKLSNHKHYAPSEQMQRETAIPWEPETTLLEEGTTLLEENETTLLRETISARLIREKNGDSVRVCGTTFSIGKSSDNDLCLSDNRTVSRRHALICEENGNYFIMDVGSTNHTYLNGEALIPNDKTELRNGDVVKLADEEFKFQIEY